MLGMFMVLSRVLSEIVQVDNYMNSLYTIDVCLGTPQQCMVLALDTGDYVIFI